MKPTTTKPRKRAKPTPPPTPQPRVHVLNPAFEYTSSHQTDLRKSFAKVRDRIAEEKAAQARADAAAAAGMNVEPIRFNMKGKP